MLGSERQETRRSDNQLRGRSGRQGDPGRSRFYLSLEDDLMRLFATGFAARALDPSRYPENEPLEFKMVANSIERAQNAIEARNAEIRKNVLKYDDVMDEQRKIVYGERREILTGKDLEETIAGYRKFVVEDVVMGHVQGEEADDWNLESLWVDLRGFYRPSF